MQSTLSSAEVSFILGWGMGRGEIKHVGGGEGTGSSVEERVQSKIKTLDYILKYN